MMPYNSPMKHKAPPEVSDASFLPDQAKRTASVIDLYGEQGYTPLKEYGKSFRSSYTAAVIDLAKWAHYHSEDQPSLSTRLGDSYQNVTSLMKALDTDRKEVYSLLHSDTSIMDEINKNRQQEIPATKSIKEIVEGFGSEEGKRVFFKAKTNNYFGISEATKLAEQLYTKRIYDELGQDKKLAAYALGVSVKTVENKLKGYEESVSEKKVIPFEEWSAIKPNEALIQYYQSRQTAEEQKDTKKAKTKQTAALLEDIPKNRKGRLFKPNKRLRELGITKTDDSHLEKIAEEVSRLAA